MVTGYSPTNIKSSAMGSEIQVLTPDFFFFLTKYFMILIYLPLSLISSDIWNYIC